MHYFGAVVVPVGTMRDEVEKVVESVLAPHEESYDEAKDECSGVWDWWQVGGRWTGVWGEYDPMRDPANIVGRCPRCCGSGVWGDGACNACGGSGNDAVWPTDFVPYDGDVIPARALLNNPPLRRPATLFLPDGRCLVDERWDQESRSFVRDPAWEETLMAALEPYRSACLVVVDYHS